MIILVILFIWVLIFCGSFFFIKAIQRSTLNQLRHRLKKSSAQSIATNSKLFIGEQLFYVEKNKMLGWIKKVAITSLVLITVGAIILRGFSLGLITKFIIPIFILIITIKIIYKMIRNNKIKKFIKLFPSTLDRIVYCLKSAQVLPDIIKGLGEEKMQSAWIYHRINQQLQLGKPLVAALNKVSSEVNIAVFDYFIIILKVQHETGSSIINAIASLAENIRQQQALRDKIDNLTQEGKISAVIMGFLPIVVLLIIFFISPKFFVPLFTHRIGHIILFIAILLELMGAYLSWRVLQIRE